MDDDERGSDPKVQAALVLIDAANWLQSALYGDSQRVIDEILASAHPRAAVTSLVVVGTRLALTLAERDAVEGESPREATERIFDHLRRQLGEYGDTG
ncbi:MAG TPA: hypothetical protein VHN98_04315 [Acidimicrobiales bacterium]|nr:hypothetical protein [Acidimicrobiales bacterium]